MSAMLVVGNDRVDTYSTEKLISLGCIWASNNGGFWLAPENNVQMAKEILRSAKKTRTQNKKPTVEFSQYFPPKDFKKNLEETEEFEP
jgi:hypothetical protein